MELLDAIYTRRSVRNYTEQQVGRDLVEKLIDCATQAPSAMNSQPWSFAVIQDKALLDKLSVQTKAYIIKSIPEIPILANYRPVMENPDYHIFYHAGTLLTVFARPLGPNPIVDCAIAGQTIMLAAHSMGLASCWIGFAQRLLNSEEAKKELGIPVEYTAVAPIILGYPVQKSGLMQKREPEILFWK